MNTISYLVSMICNNCGKKLAEIKLKEGIVSIKCKCGTINVQETKSTIKSVNNANSIS